MRVLLVVLVMDVDVVIVAVVVGGGGCRFLRTRRDFLVFTATTTNRYVTEGATFCPVPAAGFAEVTWLG